MNLLDSHDVPRAMNTLEGDVEALKLALFFLFLSPGAPCIYYGTEIGLDGGEEPGCREAFPWEKRWNIDLRVFIKELAFIRSNFLPFLRKGMQWEALDLNGIYGWIDDGESQISEQRKISVFINRSRKSWVKIPAFSYDPYFLEGKLELPKKGLGPQSAALFFKPGIEKRIPKTFPN